MEIPLREISSIDGVLCLKGRKYVLTERTDVQENGAYVFNGDQLIRPIDHETNTYWQTFINQAVISSKSGSGDDEISLYFPRRINIPE